MNAGRESGNAGRGPWNAVRPLPRGRPPPPGRPPPTASGRRLPQETAPAIERGRPRPGHASCQPHLRQSPRVIAAFPRERTRRGSVGSRPAFEGPRQGPSNARPVCVNARRARAVAPPPLADRNRVDAASRAAMEGSRRATPIARPACADPRAEPAIARPARAHGSPPRDLARVATSIARPGTPNRRPATPNRSRPRTSARPVFNGRDVAISGWRAAAMKRRPPPSIAGRARVKRDRHSPGGAREPPIARPRRFEPGRASPHGRPESTDGLPRPRPRPRPRPPDEDPLSPSGEEAG